MRVIAVVSPLGGSGRTTLVAHLAAMGARQGQPCLAVELCAQNLLGKHLGMPGPSAHGWAALAAQDVWWADGGFGNSDGVNVLPFGPATLQTIAALHQRLETNPEWLQEQLELLDVPEHCTVLLDTPQWPSPLADAALRCADTVLVVLEASGRGYASADSVRTMLQASPAPIAAKGVAVARFDPRRASQRDALNTLRQQWGGQLLPYTVHEDENISRALAASQCVNSMAPQAQSAHDLQGIFHWLNAVHPLRMPTLVAPEAVQP
jgi:cellulose synthase operon protein YhjQ